MEMVEVRVGWGFASENVTGKMQEDKNRTIL